jgi:hypothetical protein
MEASMIHLLKRHPIPITAFLSQSLVLTYAFQPDTLAPMLPDGLILDTFRGFAYLAIALVQTKQLRPSFLPAAFGRDFFLSGYRIFTRLAGGAQSKRGLLILRSDTDHGWMVNVGNMFTHYHYRLCQAVVGVHDGKLHFAVRTPKAEADLDVTADLGDQPASLPENSPFASLAEARRFAGPLPYTFDYEVATRSIIGIQAQREGWSPQPVTVHVRRSTFLEKAPFGDARPILANAFHIHDVPYHWRRGEKLL